MTLDRNIPDAWEPLPFSDDPGQRKPMLVYTNGAPQPLYGFLWLQGVTGDVAHLTFDAAVFSSGIFLAVDREVTISQMLSFLEEMRRYFLNKSNQHGQ